MDAAKGRLIGEKSIMNQKPSTVPTVLSIITFGISALAFVCAIILILISVFAPKSGGTSTALTGSAVLFVSGMVLFAGATWLLAMIGGFAGFVMVIVDLVLKRTNILWMPVTAMFLDVVSIIISVFAFS